MLTDMNLRAFLAVVFFSFTVSAQVPDKAIATYSINEKLIGLSNLSVGLSDCPIRSVMGKVRERETFGSTVSVKIKVDKKTKVTVLIPLDRVADSDRVPLFRHLITKNNTIRVSGYGCSEDAPFAAFSVDRVY